MPSTRSTIYPEGRYITVFTDASFDRTTGAFGWAAWAKHSREDEPIRLHGRGYTETSATAEFEAIRAAVEMLCTLPLLKGRTVVLQSDCTGAIGKGDALLRQLEKCGAARAYFKHVRGHSGADNPRSAVNNWCDREARKEMRAHRAAHYKSKKVRS